MVLLYPTEVIFNRRISTMLQILLKCRSSKFACDPKTSTPLYRVHVQEDPGSCSPLANIYIFCCFLLFYIYRLCVVPIADSVIERIITLAFLSNLSSLFCLSSQSQRNRRNDLRFPFIANRFFAAVLCRYFVNRLVRILS